MSVSKRFINSLMWGALSLFVLPTTRIGCTLICAGRPNMLCVLKFKIDADSLNFIRSRVNGRVSEFYTRNASFRMELFCLGRQVFWCFRATAMIIFSYLFLNSVIVSGSVISQEVCVDVEKLCNLIKTNLMLVPRPA